MFYDKEVLIYIKGKKIKNNLGMIIREKEKFFLKIYVDVQPYSTGEVKKEYGLDIECNKRVFMDKVDLCIDEHIFLINNKKYEIKNIIDWDSYMEVMLNEVH